MLARPFVNGKLRRTCALANLRGARRCKARRTLVGVAATRGAERARGRGKSEADKLAPRTIERAF
ncbi:hypothetical protein D6817_02740 [Candidatus Pacearchaeota archaeon]|nr:MAG: hypothetical protein D6817_02740 [Candidatus Pacearchaeota archaeon]